MTTSATCSLEIELAITGTVTPGYAGDRTDPPEGPSVEDVEIAGVFALRRAAINWDRIDLLEGVDTKSPAVQKLIANLLDFVGSDATDALMDEAVS